MLPLKNQTGYEKSGLTIPIVFSVGVDPVAEGLVASLAHPGSNLTGVSLLASVLPPKRLEMLCELVRSAKVTALLVNPNESGEWVADVQIAARAKGVELPILKAGNEGEIDAAFAALAGLQADALIEGDAVLFMAQREQLVALERHYRIPAIGRFREFADAGGLISYGPDLVDTNRQLGIYAAKILNGAKPQLLFARADEVIE